MQRQDVSQILSYFSEISDKQLEQFKDLTELYAEWNSKINVISRKDMDGIVVKHLLHSLAIAKIIQFKEGTSILDIGTGGGFPGVPLAVFFPDVKFHLVDSIGKKIKVVNDIKDQLKLNNLTAEHKRAEQVDGTFDFIVSRAVAPIKNIVSWSHSKFKSESFNELKNGYLFLKGGDLTAEIKASKMKCKEHFIHDIFDEEFFETKKIVYAQINNRIARK